MNRQKIVVGTRALVMLSFVLTSARVFSQSVPVKTLSKPAQIFAEPFSDVAGVREQSDGRVVVLDKQEIKIVRVDFNAGKSTPLGRSGQGPGEYTLPLHLVALPGDTTVAMDMVGGGTHIIITRDSVAGTRLRAKGFENNKPIVMRDEIGADSKGRIYEEVTRYRTENGKRMRTDSEGVRRLDRSTGKEDTLASYARLMRSELFKPVSRPKKDNGGDDRGAAMSSSEPPPFASVDQWAVAPDGRIAIVTVFPYQVTFYNEDGKRTQTAPIEYKPVVMTSGLKDTWRQSKQRPVLSLSYRDGKKSAGHYKPEYTEPTAWPRELPPFVDNALRFAPDGNLWIERVVAANAPPTFDVIDRTGRVAYRVALPLKSRLVGLGNRTVYLVRIDADDLQHLERHILPQ